MSKLCILFSITLILSFIVISLASWDAPVQTIEKEETIPIPHNSHQQDSSSISVISNQDEEVRENRVDPVLIVTTSFPSSSSPSLYNLISPMLLLVISSFLYLIT